MKTNFIIESFALVMHVFLQGDVRVINSYPSKIGIHHVLSFSLSPTVIHF